MELLGTPRRRQLLENIWQRASLSKQQFEEIYQRPLANYAELVQQLPASENHHHAHPGGMIDHGLEIVAYALKVRQTYLLPVGAAPESQSAQAEAWSAAAAYGALAHDIGKIVVDLQVELQDGSTWHPWNGPINQPYRFKYEVPRIPAPRRCISATHPPTASAHCTRLAQSLSRAVGSIDLPVRGAVRARRDPRRNHREGRPSLRSAGVGR